VGVIVLVLSWIRENNPDSAPWMSWVNAVLGVWMIISPFILGLTAVTGVMTNFIIVGIAFLVFGVWSALVTQRVRTA
jgi:VIT1/CCC1 family predicted Fe2+/Mn2+ transporter